MIGDTAVKKELKSGGLIASFPIYDERLDRSAHVYYAPKKVDPKWLLINVVYDDEAFAELTRMRRNILWLTIIGLAVLILIIQLFARNWSKLHHTLMQQHRSDRELQIANNIQQAMLPLDEPTLRGVSAVNVEGCLIPAREVGGDLYNVFIRDNMLFFCIGDTSGKGVPSALIMAVFQTLFHTLAMQESNPANIMHSMNATACRNNPSNMFITLFVGVLDLSTGTLRYCNAGHEKPIFIGQQSPLEIKPNLPIGLFEDTFYEMQQTTIVPGQTLFLYTDGLTEARNAQGHLYGRNRLIELTKQLTEMSPKEIVDATIAEMEHFARNTEQSDDLTILAIRFNNKGELKGI